MKILVMELARLGDIYQTWPALRGLKRLHPNATIDVLTRSRFQAAFDGLEVINSRKILPSQDLIEPLLNPTMDVKKSHDLLGEFIQSLQDEKYDWILNFSFSPLSSYLTHAIANGREESDLKICGYSRTSDGFLAIPDDMSAYFYAQVGINKPNRFHLAEIFGTLVGVDLLPQDWKSPEGLRPNPEAPEILIHVGASEISKQISPAKWTAIINQIVKIHPYKVGLIGASVESRIAEIIMASVPTGVVKSFVGQTDLKQLFDLIAGSKLVIGADSAPMHMASLTGTPCLNLSLESVNFWETGPRALYSVVVRGKDESDFISDRVADIAVRILQGKKQDLSVITLQPGTPSYWTLAPKGNDFQWNLLKAIYQSEDFPETDDKNFQDGIAKLYDINQLMIEQMEAIQNGADLEKLASIIDRGEEIILTIGQIVPNISPLIRWYQTEKIRIGPNTQAVLLEKSLRIQKLFHQVLELYMESFGLLKSNLTNANAEVPR